MINIKDHQVKHAIIIHKTTNLSLNNLTNGTEKILKRNGELVILML